MPDCGITPEPRLHLQRPSREHLEDLLSRFGTHTASYVLLEGRKCYLTLPGRDGFLAWETRAGCPVMADDPVCDPLQAPDLLRALRRRAFPRPVFVYAASVAMRDAYRAAGFSAVPVGAEPVFDPRAFTLAGGARATLRAAVNHAVKAGVLVREHDPLDPAAGATNRELREISGQWLADRGDEELGFLLGRPELEHATRKRHFVAYTASRVEGFLVCEPVLARNGWYLDVTRRRPDAVRGTMELLATSAIRRFGAEGSSFASLGLAPLARLDEGTAPPADSHALLTQLRRAFDHLRSPYDFRELARYKAKYAPDAWEPSLLCYSGPVAERLARLAITLAMRRARSRQVRPTRA